MGVIKSKIKKGQFSISTDAVMGMTFMIVVAFFIMHMRTSDYIFTKSVDDSNNKSIIGVVLYQIQSCEDILMLDSGKNPRKFIFNYSKISSSASFKSNVENCIGYERDWAIKISVLDPKLVLGQYVMRQCTSPVLPDCELTASSGANQVDHSDYSYGRIDKLVDVVYGNKTYIAKLSFGLKI